MTNRKKAQPLRRQGHRTRRRELLSLLAGATVAPPALRAQQTAMPVIGFLAGTSPGPFAAFVAAFRQGLSETGHVEGQNVTIEYRWAEDRYNQLPVLAADLVERNVNLIATGSMPAALAAKDATSTIPVVFETGIDPVKAGLVPSFARPGGNLTGVCMLTAELLPKQFELLSELVRQASVIGLLVNPTSSNAERMISDVQEAAGSKGAHLDILKAATESAIDAAFASLVQLHADALVVAPDPFFVSRRGQLVALASRNSLPTIYPLREFTASGGLISYGANITAAFHLLGTYAGRVLNGEKPGDLPIQQPSTFELVINLATAKALGLTIPPSILARADEVIE
jgi:putative tryptophan/tyrosine transport system substrate-binding protein